MKRAILDICEAMFVGTLAALTFAMWAGLGAFVAVLILAGFDDYTTGRTVLISVVWGFFYIMLTVGFISFLESTDK